MITELMIFTIIALIATIGPVYKIRKLIAFTFYVPFLGWFVSLGYGFFMSWLMLTLFSFQSSVAGLANMLASILFSVWMYTQKPKKALFKSKRANIELREPPKNSWKFSNLN